MATPTNPKINVHTYYYSPPASVAGAPAVIVQVTVVGDSSYMIWAGTCEEIPGADSLASDTNGGSPQRSILEDSEENAISVTQGVHPRVTDAIRQGRLAKDWACAMPVTNPSVPNSATSLFRSNDSEVVSMAQRLARRWKKQVFLSVDLPPKFEQGPLVALEVEKRVVESLKRVETIGSKGG